MDIFSQCPGIKASLDENSLKTPLKEMAAPAVLEIQIDRVSRIDEVHDLGKIGFRCF
jgi:hypothetical protein